MNPLLIALLGVLLVPLFVATWRTSLLGLSAQGLLMAWIAYRLGLPSKIEDWLTLADLAVVRGVWAPFALYSVLRAQNAPPRNDVIPPNLLSWTAAFALVVVAFSFAQRLVPEGGQEQTLVAVAAAGVLLGFLVLATQSEPLGQMNGALRIENAIALLELGGTRHPEPLSLRLAQVAAVVVTVGLFRWHLRRLGELTNVTQPASAPSSSPRSTPSSSDDVTL